MDNLCSALAQKSAQTPYSDTFTLLEECNLLIFLVGGAGFEPVTPAV